MKRSFTTAFAVSLVALPLAASTPVEPAPTKKAPPAPKPPKEFHGGLSKTGA